MTRQHWIGVLAGSVIVAFLIGFFVSWPRARALDRELAQSRAELEATRFELEMYQLQGRIGAALAEAQRSNYERARQLMTEVFSSLQANLPRMTEPDQRQVAARILEHRDEIITQLSRAEPESVQRLRLLYTQMFAAVDPLGRDAPAAP